MSDPPRSHDLDLNRSAWIEVDLDQLVENYASIQRLLPPGVMLDPVVKGNAYGHGVAAVAKALEMVGARRLCVATFDEALELRASGIRVAIHVLFPVPPHVVQAAARQRIEITAGDVTLFRRGLARLRRATARVRDSEPLRVHIEVETGLGRTGVRHDELVTLLAEAIEDPAVTVEGLWSHLAAPLDRAKTQDQASQLDLAIARCRDLITGHGLDPPAAHLLASGGVMAWLGHDVGAFDRVRVGLSLYGLVPGDVSGADRRQLPVRPAMSLKARPIRVALLPAGSGIGYGPAFVTDHPTRVATLPVGYADGYSRSHSNRGFALVRGQRAPVIGTVAMDATMVDVTDVPGSAVTVDDEFVLLGAQGGQCISADELAAQQNTISYEIVTSLSRRLARVYWFRGAWAATTLTGTADGSIA